MAHGKRYRQQYEKVDRDRSYPPAEAIALVKETASAKFDETIELHINLGIDPSQSDQAVRGRCLPVARQPPRARTCLLYTSDAADEL